MSNKSEVRQAAEFALSEAGAGIANLVVFVDRSKSGHRVKFAFLRPGEQRLAKIRKQFAALYPKNDTRVWFVNPAHSMGYSGLAFKVFNN